MPVLFRTIYACGLRCSEARLLRVEDVDIDTGVLQIRDAKGGKDRQLPVSEQLRERLAGYHATLAGQPGWEWFFPGATPDVPLDARLVIVEDVGGSMVPGGVSVTWLEAIGLDRSVGRR